MQESIMASKIKSGATGCLGCCGRQVDGFTTFLLRGNVVDLAVAVVVGRSDSHVKRLAFTTPIDSQHVLEFYNFSVLSPNL